MFIWADGPNKGNQKFSEWRKIIEPTRNLYQRWRCVCVAWTTEKEDSYWTIIRELKIPQEIDSLITRISI